MDSKRRQMVTVPKGPENPKLSKPTRLRIYEEDERLVKTISSKTGLDGDEVRRKSLHIGVQEWLALIPKAA